MILNVTVAGQSRDFELDLPVGTSDDDVRRIAVELTQSWLALELEDAYVRRDAFANYVIDRMPDDRIYLRPKVPFGS